MLLCLETIFAVVITILLLRFSAGSTDEWRMMFDTNVIGLCISTREGVQQMIKDKVDGHVVHINSIAGHRVTLHDPPSANVYPASKHAVTALTESLRQEMNHLKNKIKVTVSLFYF